MLSREIEFRAVGDEVEMWCERDCTPFDDYVIGVFRKDDEGFYRLHASTGAVMRCKHLREAAQKVSELNYNPN